MTAYIFIRELQGYLLNRSMIFTWALIIGLFVLNASVSVFQYGELVKKHEALVEKNQQILAVDPWSGEINTLPNMVSLTQQLVNPPSSLIFLSGTSEGLIPDGSMMECFWEPQFATFTNYNPYINPYFSIDWTSLMVYVISFFCICFSYNAFSGEREDGTLKLMLANNLSRTSVILGKFLSLLVVFLLPLLIGIMLGCFIFECSPAHHTGNDGYAKIAYFFLVSALLISITILGGFFISALTQKSYVSLIICLLVWTMMVIIIPNISWIITRQTEKIPTETYLQQEEKQQQDALKDCYMGWPGNKATVETAIQRKECYERRDHIHNSLWSQYHNLQFEQTRKAIDMSKISPFGLYRFLGDHIAGNNYYGYVSFFERVRNYQISYKNYIINKDKADPESHHVVWRESNWLGRPFMSHQTINPAELPEFNVPPASFGEVVAGSLTDVAILCLWCIGLFVAAFAAFVRYDVR